jgi:hypothetical protein
MEKYKVTLTVEERQALDRMVSSGKAAARKLVHARILLLGDEGPGGPRCTDEEIVEALNLSSSKNSPAIVYNASSCSISLSV